MPTIFVSDGQSQQICDRIRAEYREMPGLRLTAPQAQRLWRLNPTDCEAVLTTLVQEGFLTLSGHAYCRRGAVS